jgi:thiol-disulfide isomerase/thioredoxin
MTTTMTAEDFQRGMTLAQYLEQMTMNRDRFLRAMSMVTLGPDDHAVLEHLGRPRYVMVITEDWCGTSLAYVPFVAKLVEATPGIELRIFLRDENPTLMDRYLKRGLYRSIPVIAFFDEQMNERARFIEERPA